MLGHIKKKKSNFGAEKILSEALALHTVDVVSLHRGYGLRLRLKLMKLIEFLWFHLHKYFLSDDSVRFLPCLT